MKVKKAIIDKVKADLAYHEMMVRIDERAAEAGRRKCQELAAKLRDLTKES